MDDIIKPAREFVSSLPVFTGCEYRKAAINNTNAMCEELAVEAALTGDPSKVYYSIITIL